MRALNPDDFSNSQRASRMVCREYQLNHLSVTTSDRASIITKKDVSGDQQYYKKRLIELQEQL